MLSCERCNEQMVDYIDGTLAPALRDEMAAHIGGRSGCQRCVQAYQRAAALGSQAVRGQLPAGLDTRLRAFLRRHLTE